jgi:23S rRNA pseudouridine2605 synthase
VRQRIQKILAGAGTTSRRGTESLLRAGCVTIDGPPARLGDRADPEIDVVALDGRRLVLEPPVYWLVHKPRGVLTTTRDPFARRTVLGLLPASSARLFPVGRLDRDTEGLVLLTNDGAVAHTLLHPSLGTEREYRVTARGRLAAATLRRIARGVELEDGPTAPAGVASARFDRESQTTSFTLTLHEGRKRQIRRSLKLLGHPVVRLRRTRMGPLRLGRLAPGAARPLTAAELGALRRHVRARRRDSVSAGEEGAGALTRGGRRRCAARVGKARDGLGKARPKAPVTPRGRNRNY